MALSGLTFLQVQASDVVRAIQLSLAPVFLLNGIGVLLGLLTSRISRIVDRARVMEQRLPEAPPEEAEELYRNIDVIRRRARLINRAITLSTFTALLVAAIVALLFASAIMSTPVGSIVVAMFIAAMLSLVVALWCFLLEIRISTATLRFVRRRRQ